jgi:GNAT superfamily N-acetyltransferase
MRIRSYEERDYPSLLLLGAYMHYESDFAQFEFNPDRVRQLEALVLTSLNHYCFVAENDKGIIGAFVGGVAEFFFSHDKFGFDYLLYIRPEFRGSSAAYRLMLAAMTFCKNAGAKQLRFGVSTGINPEEADRFYKKLGFQQSGILYTRLL